MGIFRKPKSDGEYAREIYDCILDNPGLKPFAIARVIGFKEPANIYSRLTTLENFGLLVYEDDHGRLYAYEG